MLKSIEKQFLRFENQRINTLQSLNGLTNEQLSTKPDLESWNLVQVLEHLYLSELASYQYMKKKIETKDSLAKSGFKHAWRTFLLKTILRLPLKFKVPSKAPVNPTGAESFETLVEKWNKLRQDLKILLGNLSEDTAQQLCFKHPRIGYINAFQALSFLREHFNHHTAQIARIKKIVTTP